MQVEPYSRTEVKRDGRRHGFNEAIGELRADLFSPDLSAV